MEFKASKFFGLQPKRVTPTEVTYELSSEQVQQLTALAHKTYANQLRGVAASIATQANEMSPEPVPLQHIIRIEEMDNWCHVYLDGVKVAEDHDWAYCIGEVLTRIGVQLEIR